MFEYLMSLIGSTKSVLTWIHAAHHVTKGTGFSGDHVNLFGEIYQEMLEVFDELVEKSIVLCDTEEVACPLTITELSLVVLKEYESPVNLDGDQIAVIALNIVRDFSLALTQVYYALQEQRQLSLGMDDFLSSTAGKFDKFEYLLSQRIKKGY